MELNKTQTTLAGARILTLATQSSKLLFTKCVATTQTFTTETAVNLNTVPEGIAANSVRLAGIDANRILVRAEFKNVDLGETPRERFAAVLCGRRENSNDVETPICVSFGEEAFTLPIAGAPVSALELLFTITMSPGVDAVSTQTSALEASKAELDQLRIDVGEKLDGYVTLGTAQTITSEKTFEGVSGKSTTMRGFGMINESETSAYTCGLVGVDDTFRITAENTTEGENTAEIKVDASLGQIALSANGEITVDANITPTTTATVLLGAPTKTFSGVHTQNLYTYAGSTFGAGITINGGIARGGTSAFNIGSSSAPFGTLYALSVNTSSTSTFGNVITVTGGILRGGTTASDIGAVGTRFGTLYAQSVNTSSTSTFGDAITVTGGISRGGTTASDIGDSETRFGTLYAQSVNTSDASTFGGRITVDGSVLLSDSGVGNIGSKSSRFGTVYSEAINTEDLSLRVFAIKTTNSTGYYLADTQWTNISLSSGFEVYQTFVEADTTGVMKFSNRNIRITNGEIKPLSAIKADAISNGKTVFALCMYHL